jgi:hypothetical protein
MDPENEPENPLLWAILEFRETLNRLIEEQKALVLSRAVEEAELMPAASVSAERFPARVAPSPAPQPLVVAIAATAELEAKPRKPVAPGRPELPGVTSPLPSPAEMPETEAMVAARLDDPRQRLDALARLLDKRLRQSAAQGTETGTRTVEG